MGQPEKFTDNAFVAVTDPASIEAAHNRLAELGVELPQTKTN